MRPSGQLVQIASHLLAREVASGERQIGGHVAVEPAQTLDLGRLEAPRILPGPPKQAFQLVPAAAMGGDELVNGSQWTTPTS